MAGTQSSEGNKPTQFRLTQPAKTVSAPTSASASVPQVQASTAYLLWFLWLFGICGGQRLYSGKIFSGLIYLFTFGLLGVGQLIDLALIPGMVEKRNIHLRGRYARNLDLAGFNSAVTLNMGEIPRSQFVPPPVTVSPMQKLLRIAKQEGGTLSIAQVALYTELEPEQVKALLQEAERYGYAEVCNDPHTGAIRYRFDL